MDEGVGKSTLEREVQAALAVDPAPDFVARIRLATANEPMPSAPRIWRLVALCAAPAALVLVLLVLRAGGRVYVNVIPLTGRQDSRNSLGARPLASRPILSPLMTAVSPDVPGRPLPHERPQSSQRAASVSRPGVNAATPGPAVLIPWSEQVALRRLIAAVNNGDPAASAAVTMAFATEPEGDSDRVAPQEIVIPPIVLEPLASEQPQSSGEPVVPGEPGGTGGAGRAARPVGKES